jgi:hypothetical protein
MLLCAFSVAASWPSAGAKVAQARQGKWQQRPPQQAFACFVSFPFPTQPPTVPRQPALKEGPAQWWGTWALPLEKIPLVECAGRIESRGAPLPPTEATGDLLAHMPHRQGGWAGRSTDRSQAAASRQAQPAAAGSAPPGASSTCSAPPAPACRSRGAQDRAPAQRRGFIVGNTT